ncbi:MAG: B12-binding domain-containing radical SAM protein [Elusimicrobia bacterium]|nr:B12-binding domain-containing radical SAM protein [Elusimicrobiota bacterium]
MFVYGAFENLGIEYLSSVLKLNGHDTCLALDPLMFSDPFLTIRPVDRLFDYREELLREIIRYDPDVAAFSATSSYFRRAINIAGDIKRISPRTHIVFGGVHVSSVPEKVITSDCVDSLIVGEGEYAFLELVEALEKKKTRENIGNLWTKTGGSIIRNPPRPYIDDLDSLPFPDKDLYYSIIPGYAGGYTAIATRGCVNSCAYCSSPVMQALYPGQKKMRFRSVGNVISELSAAKKRYNFGRLRINDNIFTIDSEWLREFAEAYEKYIGVPVYCFTYPDYIDGDKVRYLKQINTYQVCLGVQSPIPSLRGDVLNRISLNSKTAEAVRLLKNNGIRCVTDVILGIPGETDEQLEETALYFNRLKPDRVCVFWLVYYPKLPIIDKALASGELSETQGRDIENNPYEAANTVINRRQAGKKLRYHWMILFSFLPRILFLLLVKTGFFRLLQGVDPSGISSFYTMLGRDRLDIPRMRYYTRYWHFTKKIVFSRMNIFRIRYGG